jgi:hypothetical protein
MTGLAALGTKEEGTLVMDILGDQPREERSRTVKRAGTGQKENGTCGCEGDLLVTSVAPLITGHITIKNPYS